MSELTTHVGIDAHKAELHVAMLAPDASRTRSTERRRRSGASAAQRLMRDAEAGQSLRLAFRQALRTGRACVPADRTRGGRFCVRFWVLMRYPLRGWAGCGWIVGAQVAAGIASLSRP